MAKRRASTGPETVVVCPGVRDIANSIKQRGTSQKSGDRVDDAPAGGFGDNVQLLDKDIALLSFRFGACGTRGVRATNYHFCLMMSSRKFCCCCSLSAECLGASPGV